MYHLPIGHTTYPLTTPPTNHLPPTSHKHHYSGSLSPFYGRRVAGAARQLAFQTSTLDKREGSTTSFKKFLHCPAINLRLTETPQADVHLLHLVLSVCQATVPIRVMVMVMVMEFLHSILLPVEIIGLFVKRCMLLPRGDHLP